MEDGRVRGSGRRTRGFITSGVCFSSKQAMRGKVQTGQRWVVGALFVVLYSLPRASNTSFQLEASRQGAGPAAGRGRRLPRGAGGGGALLGRRRRAAGRAGGRGRAAAADSPAINSPGYMSCAAQRRPQCPRPRATGAPQLSGRLRPSPSRASRGAGLTAAPRPPHPSHLLVPGATPLRRAAAAAHLVGRLAAPSPAGSPTCRLPLPQDSPAVRTAR